MRQNRTYNRFLRLWIPIFLLIVSTACTLTSSGTGQTNNPAVISGQPLVTISSPLPNATYLEGTSVNIVSRIENAGADIARVEVSLDGAIIGTATTPNPSGAASFTVEQGWPSTVGSHTISVIAYRNDGTASAPKEVKINVVAPAQSGNNSSTTSGDSGGENTAVPTQQPAQPTADTSAQGGTTGNQQVTNPPAPTNTLAPSNTPEPTAIPPTNTPSKPMIKVAQGLNVRSGPSTVFNPPIGSLAANDEAEILAVNRDSSWYKIRYYNGEGWVWAQLVTTTGDLSRLPVDAGPPTPIPTNTPLPPTATPIPVQVNLVVANIQTKPHPLKCGKASEIQVTVRNDGTAGSTNGGLINVKAIRVSDGQVLAQTDTPFPALQPGQTHTAGAFLTVTTYIGELQRIVVTVDSTSQVPENNENDNTKNDADYALLPC